MTATFKPLAVEQACNSTPSTFGGSRLVRLLETGTGNALITRAYANGTTIATFTLRQGTDLSVIKDWTDTLSSNTASVVGVPIGFSN